ncbi:MAG: C40 family peptidase [Lachnospiraceae bacterium]|nr:C40 family peptidase [Lachnospiraceae bacterium]
MEIRARRIYETGNTSFINMLLEGLGFGKLLNRLDYVEQVYSYDKNKLSEYEAMRKLTKEMWDQLQAEKAQLQKEKDAFELEKADLELAKQDLDRQKEELDQALAVRKRESANFEAEIKKAKQEANMAKALIRQEQQELANLQSQAMAGQTAAATGTYTDTGYTSIVDAASGTDLQKRVAKYALQFVGNPYQMGGTSLTNGTDCSGFTMRVYKDFGYNISRTSYQQRSDGIGVSYSEAQPGDIICYEGHVGLYIGGGKIVHASNKRDGIKVSNATYRSIITVRRIIH